MAKDLMTEISLLYRRWDQQMIVDVHLSPSTWEGEYLYKKGCCIVIFYQVLGMSPKSFQY